jgi:hypothetical protein
MTHRELCIIAAKYLKNKLECKYVVCELERVGESPDAFGFGSVPTILVECKISRSDFLSDKNKLFRLYPEKGVGEERYYLCPVGIIKELDLPEKWGLLYIDENKKITEIVKPETQEHNYREEIELICSIFRREGISPKTFSYKKYKNL